MSMSEELPRNLNLEYRVDYSRKKSLQVNAFDLTNPEILAFSIGAQRVEIRGKTYAKIDDTTRVRDERVYHRIRYQLV